MFDRLSPFQRSLISAFAGLLAYGLWAYFANMAHGFKAGIKAACVQGGYSFVLTFVMTMLIESLYRFLIQKHWQRATVMTIVTVCLTLYASSWLLNYLVGTPEILMTVLPGYVIGSMYTYSYVLKLAKSGRQSV